MSATSPMTAFGGPQAICGFVFAADSGDAWGGWFIAAADAFTAGAEPRMPAGAYTGLGQTTDVFKVELFGLQVRSGLRRVVSRRAEWAIPPFPSRASDTGGHGRARQ